MLTLEEAMTRFVANDVRALSNRAQTSTHITPNTIAFHTLNIFGLALISAVLATALMGRRIRIRRLGTWYVYMWTQFALPIVFLLHPFKPSNYNPAFASCLIQASLVYATPPTISWALLMLVIEVFALIQARSAIPGRCFRCLLLCTPVNVFFCGTTLVLIEGFKHPSSVGMQHDLSYCHLSIMTPAIVAAVVYLIPIIVCIPLLGMIALEAIRNSRLMAHDRLVLTIPPTSIIRIGIILFVPIIGFGYAFPKNELEDLIQFLPLVPILTAVAFGSQRDMVSAACSAAKFLCCRVSTR